MFYLSKSVGWKISVSFLSVSFLIFVGMFVSNITSYHSESHVIQAGSGNWTITYSDGNIDEVRYDNKTYPASDVTIYSNGTVEFTQDNGDDIVLLSILLVMIIIVIAMVDGIIIFHIATSDKESLNRRHYYYFKMNARYKEQYIKGDNALTEVMVQCPKCKHEFSIQHMCLRCGHTYWNRPRKEKKNETN